jgi:hypothetical protein
MVARGLKCSIANGMHIWNRRTSTGISVNGSNMLQFHRRQTTFRNGIPNDKKKTEYMLGKLTHVMSRGKIEGATLMASFTGKNTNMTIKLPYTATDKRTRRACLCTGSSIKSLNGL